MTNRIQTVADALAKIDFIETNMKDQSGFLSLALQVVTAVDTLRVYDQRRRDRETLNLPSDDPPPSERPHVERQPERRSYIKSAEDIAAIPTAGKRSGKDRRQHTRAIPSGRVEERKPDKQLFSRQEIFIMKGEPLPTRGPARRIKSGGAFYNRATPPYHPAARKPDYDRRNHQTEKEEDDDTPSPMMVEAAQRHRELAAERKTSTPPSNPEAGAQERERRAKLLRDTILSEQFPGQTSPLPARYGANFVTWEQLPEKSRLPYYAALSALDADAQRPVSEAEVERLANVARENWLEHVEHSSWATIAGSDKKAWCSLICAILEAAALPPHPAATEAPAEVSIAWHNEDWSQITLDFDYGAVGNSRNYYPVGRADELVAQLSTAREEIAALTARDKAVAEERAEDARTIAALTTRAELADKSTIYWMQKHAAAHGRWQTVEVELTTALQQLAELKAREGVTADAALGRQMRELLEDAIRTAAIADLAGKERK